MTRIGAIALSIVLGASTAHARPPKKAAEASKIVLANEEGRQAYDRARALFTEGDFASALAALQEAQKAAPDPRLFWNIAVCEKKLGRNAAAMDHVERYLVAAGLVIGDAERREAFQFLNAVQAYVARVTLKSELDGIEVTVDGEPVGTTPFAHPIRVDEGTHVVRFARSGYRTAERSETARGGDTLTWAIELEPDVRPPPPAPEKTVTSPSPRRTVPILLMGAGAVAAVTGGVLVGITLDRASTFENECGTKCPPERWEKYRTLQTVGDVALVAGGVMLVTGLVWMAFQPRRDARASLPPWQVSF